MKFIIDLFDKAYSLLPDFSEEIKNIVERLLPPLSLLIGVLITLAAVLEILGTPFISVFTLNKSQLLQTLLLTNVLGIFQGVLMVSSFRPLRKKSMKGWRLLFFSQLLFIIGSAISLSPALILGAIFIYPLIKVKSDYH